MSRLATGRRRHRRPAPVMTGGAGSGVASLSPVQRSPAGLGSPATAPVSGVAETRRSAHGRSAVLAAGIAGTVATAVTVWSAARSRVLVEPTELAVWRGLLVASYITV